MPEPMSGVKIYGVNMTCTHSIGCLYIYIYIMLSKYCVK